MAEEGQTGEGQQTTGDEFERVTAFIRDQVHAYMREAVPQQQYPQQQQPDPQQQQHRLIAETIGPVVGPAISHAQLEAADARDEIRFYRENPDAMDHTEAVEKLFLELKQQGRALPRKDLYDAILGREYRADPDKFVEKRQAKKKEQTERAEMATDFGAAMMSKAKSDSTWANFENLSVEDMEKKLDGITF